MSKLTFQPMLESRPIREIAYEMLKHAIITGEIPAGERIVETDYADRLHISRTPLREALRKLERDGLVEYVLRRGVVVRAFTLTDVSQIYTIRNSLELLTLPAVVQNVTDKDIEDLRGRLRVMDELLAKDDIEGISPLARAFHNQIIQLSRQNRILRVIETQDEFITRFSAMAIKQENRRTEAHKEHYQLVEFLANRDLQGLETLLAHHIERSKENCIQALELNHEVEA